MKLTLAAAAALSTLVVALPGAAFADTLTHADPAKDVQQVAKAKAVKAPTQKTADIVHFKAGYTSDQVFETTRVRELAGKWALDFEIKTREASYDASLYHLGHGTQVELSQGEAEKPVTCDGIGHTIDVSKRTIALQVPASCVGSPSWVQVGAGAIALAHHSVYLDDALRKGGAVKESAPRLSKRLMP